MLYIRYICGYQNANNLSSAVKVKGQVVPQKETKREGESVQFICLSDEPVTWNFNGEPLPLNAAAHTLFVPFRTNYLSIAYIHSYNDGTYTCHGKTKDTYFESDGILRVISK